MPQRTDFPIANVVGVEVHAVDMERAVGALESAVAENRSVYVCVTGVHGVMEAQDDPQFRAILNSSYLTVPDGMPTVWVGKLQGHKKMRRVYGPDLMLEVCKQSVARGRTHFLYGGKPGVATRLAEELQKRFPGLKIVGTYCPPFRPLNAAESDELQSKLEQGQPDYLWVGLSTPKQEKFMAEYVGKLAARVMIGVGAAFDVHTGGIQDAPRWVKGIGMQWLHRLLQEPRRLWKRYLFNNPRFLYRLALQFLQAQQ